MSKEKTRRARLELRTSRSGSGGVNHSTTDASTSYDHATCKISSSFHFGEGVTYLGQNEKECQTALITPPTPAPVKYEAARRQKRTILPSLIWGKGRVCGNPTYILSEIVVSQFFLFLFLFEQVLLFYFFT